MLAVTLAVFQLGSRVVLEKRRLFNPGRSDLEGAGVVRCTGGLHWAFIKAVKNFGS